ncbi:MAG: ATP-binding domain-containing protein, partial [Ignavibacteria bacterium]|nr:ATP-binding domain-containing protein [Ignavibacteria bacterium]
IIPSCNDGNFPFRASRTKEDFTEDARLLYVAMTRAKKRLIISANKFYKSPFLKPIEHRFEKITK